MRTILLIVSSLVFMNARAQTWQEWLRQKETQKKYLLQQITALQLYIDYAEQGYTIAGNGLQTIHEIKKGDFSLHNDFFGSLKKINPAIKDWQRVVDLIAIQMIIEKQISEALNAAIQGNALTPTEIDYCRAVFDKLRKDCLQALDQLLLLTSNDNLQMTDGERIRKIEALFSDMQDKYVFTASFAAEMKLLSAQRKNESNELDQLKLLSR